MSTSPFSKTSGWLWECLGRAMSKMMHFKGYAKQTWERSWPWALIARLAGTACLTWSAGFFIWGRLVSKALVELDLEGLLLSEEETEKLSDLSEALEVLDCGSNALARRDCNLKKADQVFEYVLMSLKAQASSISMQLYDTTKESIEEWRLRIMAGLMLFLEDPEEYS